MGLFFQKSSAASEDARYEALQAEYSNYRRRTTQQLDQASQVAARNVVQQFLPIYDDLERALQAACQDEAFYHGIELMMQNLLSILASMKVVPMQSLGKCFNPDYHEAIEHVDDPSKQEEEIVAVIRTGFTMDEEVIRHAKVIVAN